MPGCGLSSRPAYAIAADPEQRRLEAESFFCDELEAWRKAMGRRWASSAWCSQATP
jgi:hypothetical protein